MLVWLQSQCGILANKIADGMVGGGKIVAYNIIFTSNLRNVSGGNLVTTDICFLVTMVIRYICLKEYYKMLWKIEIQKSIHTI